MKNNIGVFVIVFILALLGNSVYTEMSKDKTPGKAKRLQCQKMVTTFENGYILKEIKEAQKQLLYGNIPFTSSVEKSHYAKSKLFNYISLKSTDKIFKKELLKYKKSDKNKSSSYTLNYYIYENDVKDPGKKTKKSKLYAGYVVTQLKNTRNMIIYQNQIDFMDRQGADIKQTIQCGIKSLVTFNN